MQKKRIFVISGSRVTESDAMVGKTNDECQAILAKAYPEITHSTSTVTEKDDHIEVAFVARAGRKG